MDTLVKLAQEGDRDALSQLEERHRRTVWKTALVTKKRFAVLPWEDAVQAGFLGFMDAVKKYKHDLGAAFNTFLIYCVRSAVRREAEYTSLIVRVPTYLWNKKSPLVQRSMAVEELYDVIEDQDDEPEFDELDAVKLRDALQGLSVKDRDILYNAYTKHTTMRKLGKKYNRSHQAISNTYHRLVKRLRAELVGDRQ